MTDKNGFDLNEVNGLNGHHGEEAPALSSLTINHKRFAYSDKPLYRVYSAPDHFKLVEADSAYEAYQHADVARPYKIERETFYRYLALKPDQLEPGEDDAVQTDPALPDEEEMKTLLFAALGENGEGEPEELPFEEIMIADLQAESKPEVALQQPAPAPRPAPPPQTQARPAPKAEPKAEPAPDPAPKHMPEEPEHMAQPAATPAPKAAAQPASAQSAGEDGLSPEEVAALLNAKPEE